MRKNSKENKKSKNKNNVYKIKSDKLNNKLIEKDKKEIKTIEISVGFAVLKIIVIALIILLITALTAKTVMTKIRAKESTSETGNEGIASIAKIDVQYTLSDDESYSTVTITSNYPVTQIEVSEEDYNEDLEEEDYIFIVEDDWEVTEEGLVLTKDFIENIDKTYRLTFEDKTSLIQEINVVSSSADNEGPVAASWTTVYSATVYYYETSSGTTTSTTTIKYAVDGTQGLASSASMNPSQSSLAVDGYYTNGTTFTVVCSTSSGFSSYKTIASALSCSSSAYYSLYINSSGYYYYTESSTSEKTTTTLSASTYPYVRISYALTPISYTIAYNNNGGSGSMSSTSATYGTSVTLRTNTFTKTGYTFAGWSTSSSATSAKYTDGQSVSNLTTTNGGTVTLYAVWTGNSYTISYNNNGGTGSMSSTSATYGTSVTLRTNTFTKSGYKFTGWNTEADGSGTSYEDGATVSNLTTTDGDTVTLYAQWEQYSIAVTEYTGDTLEAECDYEDGDIIWYVVDGDSYDLSYILTGDSFSLSEILGGLCEVGYTCTETNLFFSGYYTYSSAEGCADEPTTDNDVSTEETNVAFAAWQLVASLSRNLPTYATAYVGGLNTETTECTYISLYYDAGNASVVIDESENTYTSAAFVIMTNIAASSYEISFNSNGADDGEMESIEATYDEEYTLTANAFTREGYTFTGWNTEADGSGTSYEDGATVSNLTTIDGDTVTLYAQWERTTISISAKVLSQEDKSTVLCGVEFSLFELICEDDSHDHTSDDDLIDVDNYDTSCWELFGTYTSDETTGEFTLEDLYITETYRLVETKTVEDYLLPSGQWNLSYSTESLEVTAIGNPPAVTIETDDDGNEILYLYNSSSYDVPTTGSFETDNFYWVGIPITLLGVFIIIRRKRLKYATGKFRSLRNSVNDARRIIDNWDKNS